LLLLHTQPQAYKQAPLFIEQLEDQFLDFLSTKAPRLSLPPMPKAQRALVHDYAEAGWGFVSHSSGSEPNRAVQLFKAPSSGLFPSAGRLQEGGWGLCVVRGWIGGMRLAAAALTQLLKAPKSDVCALN
jgi:hypothetical protein